MKGGVEIVTQSCRSDVVGATKTPLIVAPATAGDAHLPLDRAQTERSCCSRMRSFVPRTSVPPRKLPSPDLNPIRTLECNRHPTLMTPTLTLFINSNPNRNLNPKPNPVSKQNIYKAPLVT